MKKALFLIFLFFVIITFAQEKIPASNNPRIERPMGINFDLASPSILGLTFDYFISPKINLEAGIGRNGISLGGAYHFNGDMENKKWTPYIGLYAGHKFNLTSFKDDKENDVYTKNGAYIPFGMQYLNHDGIIIRFEIELQSFGLLYSGGIKIGYHF